MAGENVGPTTAEQPDELTMIGQLLGSGQIPQTEDGTPDVQAQIDILRTAMSEMVIGNQIQGAYPEMTDKELAQLRAAEASGNRAEAEKIRRMAHERELEKKQAERDKENEKLEVEEGGANTEDTEAEAPKTHAEAFQQNLARFTS